MARLEINPEYAPLLAELGLTTPAAFLRLSGVIWSGHPDRHVSHLCLEGARVRAPVFLKREHRVRLRDRLAAVLGGFGPVSKSLREFALLRRLKALGIRCPEPVAAGELQGCAFLLIREEEGAVDLRAFLQRPATIPVGRRLAIRLGQALARMHNAGVDHPDLYSKHVLVTPGPEVGDMNFTFLDWQRSRCRFPVPWSRRGADLAALDATLAEELVDESARLLCLRAYLLACRSASGLFPRMSMAAREVRQRSRQLLRHRRIREMRQPPLASGSQNLVWLDGEALCVTRQFQEETQGQLPDYLQTVYQGMSDNPASEMVELPRQSRQGQLSRRRQSSLGKWLWHKLRRKVPVSPELHQAGTLFRLERYRVKVPRLLAVGQRQTCPGRLESFLLVAPPSGTVRLLDWWRDQPPNLSTLPGRRQKGRIIAAVARCLRSIHAADCILGPNSELLLRLSAENVEVVLERVEGMRPSRRLSRTALVEDLRRLREKFAFGCTWTEQLRFLLHYLEMPRVNPVARKWLSQILQNQPGRQVQRQERSQP